MNQELSMAVPKDWYKRFKKNEEYKEHLREYDEESYDIYCKIQQMRLQILVWSRMYYELDSSPVSDFKYDFTGLELVRLQNKYPEIANHVPFAKAFKGWDASTGFDLPVKDPWVIQRATRLIKEN